MRPWTRQLAYEKRNSAVSRSVIELENFCCANCGHRGELTKHGRCEACQSESVFPDRSVVEEYRARG